MGSDDDNLIPGRQLENFNPTESDVEQAMQKLNNKKSRENRTTSSHLWLKRMQHFLPNSNPTFYPVLEMRILP